MPLTRFTSEDEARTAGKTTIGTAEIGHDNVTESEARKAARKKGLEHADAFAVARRVKDRRLVGWTILFFGTTQQAEAAPQ